YHGPEHKIPDNVKGNITEALATLSASSAAVIISTILPCISVATLSFFIVPISVACLLIGAAIVLNMCAGNDFGHSVGNSLYDFTMGLVT
uniref:hypothetical protein n=1 Tax=Methanobrevibacter sp. TaxID=66852 RepID=UPI00388F9CA1